MNKRKLTGNLLLLIAAAVWGGGYIANDAAIQHIGVFTYEMLRMFLGGLILLPVCILLRSKEKKQPEKVAEEKQQTLEEKKRKLVF